jgi:hypothetical protein|tara:strand:+ start:332 stop:595 length:264 start_codon:yes stop_codon:yes gene_type:complete
MDNDDIDEGILMLGLYRDSTGSYMQTIVPKEVAMELDFDSIRGWAKVAFPEFDVIENVDKDCGSRPCLDFMPIEYVMDWLTDIGCPE